MTDSIMELDKVALLRSTVKYWRGQVAERDAEIERLRTALEPFADCSVVWNQSTDGDYVIHWSRRGTSKPDLFITVGNLLDAAAALAQKGQ